MTIRRRALPPGWYPESRSQTERTIAEWDERLDLHPQAAMSGIAPHAGWDFSGELAYNVISRLLGNAEIVAVVGGHLPPAGRILCATEDEFETPLGPIKAEKEMRDILLNRLHIAPDSYADNTVEIQMPLVKYCYPNAGVLHLRVSPTSDAIKLGQVLYEIAEEMGKRIVVLGSTDLTHYGPAYGFAPAGHGQEAISWVREQNDRGIINAFLSMNLKLALKHSQEKSSACSAGAAVAAASFAAMGGIKTGTLAGYRLSCDFHKSDSFVGYAGICYLRDN